MKVIRNTCTVDRLSPLRNDTIIVGRIRRLVSHVILNEDSKQRTRNVQA